MDNSGLRRVVYNTLERLVSTDDNDAQRYAATAFAELFRYLIDAEQNVDTTPGYEALGTGTETPRRRAYVLGGLRFEPIAGSTSSVVSAGAALFIDNPAPVVDSLATLVEDAGVQTLGTLVLTPGAGSTRIDVVECQPVLTVEQSDNRDIFDPSSGNFVPALVPKIRAARLTYRIRSGTAGGGFPGLAAGWVPLAVCSVPAAAANWDPVTIWDVRPLVSDLAGAPFQNIRGRTFIENAEIYSDIATGGQARIYGQVDAVYRQWKAGGHLLAQGNAYVDVRATANRSGNFAGFPTSAFSQWTMYALFPFDLPRWVQYSASAPRVPTGQRGILAVTTVSPTYNGIPSAVISTPSSYGLIDTPGTAGVALVQSRCDSAGVPLAVSIAGRVTTMLNPDANPRAISTATGLYAEFLLTEGTHFPSGAKVLYVRIDGRLDITAGTGVTVAADCDVTVTNADALIAYTVPAHVAGQGALMGEFNANVTAHLYFSARVPLVHDRYGAHTPRAFKVRWVANPSAGGLGGGANVSALSTLTVVGWEI